MKTSPIEKVRELYEDTADTYSDMMDNEIDLPVYADILGRLAERIAHMPGAIIDSSCGSGHMLARYHERYDRNRLLIGIDLSPSMVAIASAKLGSKAEIYSGDMRDLGRIEGGSAAAVMSYFAIHHIEPREVVTTLKEWHRVMNMGGQLVVATWEGSGPIDYGDESDVVALRYSEIELKEWTRKAGFVVNRCVVEPVADIPMKAIYLEGTRE
jgi:ubiquinone/menaquinone biosynthesis C-methylase UbiE